MSCILLYLDKSGMILLILNQWSQKSDDNPFIICQVLNYGRVITEFEHPSLTGMDDTAERGEA